MASIYPYTTPKGRKRYVASIYRNGKRISKSFATRRDAQIWAAEQEKHKVAISTITLGEVLKRYLEEAVSQSRPDQEIRAINYMLNHYPQLCAKRLTAISKRDIAQWRDDRLKSVSAGTVRRQWNLYSSIFQKAVSEWEITPENPFRNVRRPAQPPPRERLIQWHEIKTLFRAAKYDSHADCQLIKQRVAAAFVFSLETAMRAQEICNLTWSDVEGRVAIIRKSKTRSGVRKVPLSRRALAVLGQLKPLGYHNIFGLTPTQINANFVKMKQQLGNPDYTFHDTRAAAITRLSKKLDITDLARMVGHKNLSMLMVYYRKSAEDLADKLD